MSKIACRQYLVASVFGLGTLLAVTGAAAQMGQGGVLTPGGPESMFQRLVGDWINVGSGATGGYAISIRRNGDVWQQGAPMARVAGTISAGGNFAFEGSFPPPESRPFGCVYYITFLPDSKRATFRLVEQRGEGITCAQGMFERLNN
jgi:hypothetical protein